MANRLGMPLEQLQSLFRGYCDHNPVDENVWQADVELGWPWA